MRIEKIVIGAGLLGAVGMGAVTLFGDNIRRSFGTSVNCLAGTTNAPRRAPSSTHRNVVSFAAYATEAEASAHAEALSARPPPMDEPTSRPESAPELAPNGWVRTARDPLSTFAADVDTAAYTQARRALREGRLPQAGNVRVEEFVNYFHYDYPAPTHGAFAVHTDLAPSPFHSKEYLLRVGVQAKRIAQRERKRMHLTFLVDVSGSMDAPDRLPLAKESLAILVDHLNPQDTVSLVTYAGDTREVLPPTSVEEKDRILGAIESLEPGGGTAMGSGMELAYRNAVREVREGEVSRVIVLTDGDANIGATSHELILKSIESYVTEGVTLSTVGFGTGNYHDQMLEQLADKGNGNSSYVDSEAQAERLFGAELSGLLQVVAKDVKFQVEFDPRVVETYKLVGYENRAIADKDFRDDRVDAGEIGAGHTVTAVYQLQLAHEPAAGARLATVHVRAKEPEREQASESAFTVDASQIHPRFGAAPPSFRLAMVAAGFADALRGNSDVGLAELGALAADLPSSPDVKELRELIMRAQQLSGLNVSSR